jgi:branched-chain amino acid transport system substrate-binding protein
MYIWRLTKGGIQNIIKFSDCRIFYVFLRILLSFLIKEEPTMQALKIIFLLTSTLLLNLNSNAQAETNKLGIILPLTGLLAEYGVASKNGFELARKENQEIFKDIEFVYEDSQYDPKLSISAYRKLRRDPDVKLIYSWGSNPSAPIIPIAEKECFPLLAADFSTKTFTNISCVIAFAPTSKLFGDHLIRYLLKNKVRKIGLISVENLYINGIIDGIKDSLEDDSEVVFHETVIATESDFRSYIAKLKSKKIDALGVMLYAGQVQNFYRNLELQKYTIPTFSSDFIESRTEIRGSGPLIQGAVYPHNKISEEYYLKYKKEYNDDSQVTYSGTAYDFAMMIAALFKENPEFYKSHLEYIPKMRGYKGVMGQYTYEESKEFGKRLYPPIFIKRIKGDFYEVVE